MDSLPGYDKDRVWRRAKWLERVAIVCTYLVMLLIAWGASQITGHSYEGYVAQGALILAIICFFKLS